MIWRFGKTYLEHIYNLVEKGAKMITKFKDMSWLMGRRVIVERGLDYSPKNIEVCAVSENGIALYLDFGQYAFTKFITYASMAIGEVVINCDGIRLTRDEVAIYEWI